MSALVLDELRSRATLLLLASLSRLRSNELSKFFVLCLDSKTFFLFFVSLLGFESLSSIDDESFLRGREDSFARCLV